MPKTAFFALGLAAALFAGAIAAAAPPSQTLSPSAQNQREGATTGLGTSHRFATTAAAADHCPGDVIVWLSGPNLTYRLPGAPGYGSGVGQYACKAEADDAGFTAVSP